MPRFLGKDYYHEKACKRNILFKPTQGSLAREERRVRSTLTVPLLFKRDQDSQETSGPHNIFNLYKGFQLDQPEWQIFDIFDDVDVNLDVYQEDSARVRCGLEHLEWATKWKEMEGNYVEIVPSSNPESQSSFYDSQPEWFPGCEDAELFSTVPLGKASSDDAVCGQLEEPISVGSFGGSQEIGSVPGLLQSVTTQLGIQLHTGHLHNAAQEVSLSETYIFGNSDQHLEITIDLTEETPSQSNLPSVYSETYMKHIFKEAKAEELLCPESCADSPPGTPPLSRDHVLRNAWQLCSTDLTAVSSIVSPSGKRNEDNGLSDEDELVAIVQQPGEWRPDPLLISPMASPQLSSFLDLNSTFEEESSINDRRRHTMLESPLCLMAESSSPLRFGDRSHSNTVSLQLWSPDTLITGSPLLTVKDAGKLEVKLRQGEAALGGVQSLKLNEPEVGNGDQETCPKPDSNMPAALQLAKSLDSGNSLGHLELSLTWDIAPAAFHPPSLTRPVPLSVAPALVQNHKSLKVPLDIETIEQLVECEVTKRSLEKEDMGHSEMSLLKVQTKNSISRHQNHGDPNRSFDKLSTGETNKVKPVARISLPGHFSSSGQGSNSGSKKLNTNSLHGTNPLQPVLSSSASGSNPRFGVKQGSVSNPARLVLVEPERLTAEGTARLTGEGTVRLTAEGTARLTAEGTAAENTSAQNPPSNQGSAGSRNSRATLSQSGRDLSETLPNIEQCLPAPSLQLSSLMLQTPVVGPQRVLSAPVAAVGHGGQDQEEVVLIDPEDVVVIDDSSTPGTETQEPIPEGFQLELGDAEDAMLESDFSFEEKKSADENDQQCMSTSAVMPFDPVEQFLMLRDAKTAPNAITNDVNKGHTVTTAMPKVPTWPGCHAGIVTPMSVLPRSVRDSVSEQRFVTVSLSGQFLKVLEEVCSRASPHLQQLKAEGVISADTPFLCLKADYTRYLLKDRDSRLGHMQQEAEEDETGRHLRVVHTLCSVAQLLQDCCLESAIVHLTNMQETQPASTGTTEGLRKALFQHQFMIQQSGQLHPKVAAVCREIQQHKETAGAPYRVLVVVRREQPTLMETLRAAVSMDGTATKTVFAVEGYWPKECECLITQEDPSLLSLAPSCSLAVEFHADRETSLYKACQAANISYVGLSYAETSRLLRDKHLPQADTSSADEDSGVVVVGSQQLIQHQQLLQLLETRHNVVVISRDYPSLGRKHHSDVLVSVDKGGVLLPVRQLRQAGGLETMTERLTALGLHLSTVWIFVHCIGDSVRSLVERDTLTKVVQLQALAANLSTATKDFTTSYKVLLCQTAEEVASYVYCLAKSSGASKEGIAGRGTNRANLPPEITKEERFLLGIASLNPFSCNVLLSRATVGEVLTMSHQQRCSLCPELSNSVLESLHRVVSMDTGLQLRQLTADTGHTQPRGAWEEQAETSQCTTAADSNSAATNPGRHLAIEEAATSASFATSSKRPVVDLTRSFGSQGSEVLSPEISQQPIGKMSFFGVNRQSTDQPTPFLLPAQQSNTERADVGYVDQYSTADMHRLGERNRQTRTAGTRLGEVHPMSGPNYAQRLGEFPSSSGASNRRGLGEFDGMHGTANTQMTGEESERTNPPRQHQQQHRPDSWSRPPSGCGVSKRMPESWDEERRPETSDIMCNRERLYENRFSAFTETSRDKNYPRWDAKDRGLNDSKRVIGDQGGSFPQRQSSNYTDYADECQQMRPAASSSRQSSASIKEGLSGSDFTVGEVRKMWNTSAAIPFQQNVTRNRSSPYFNGSSSPSPSENTRLEFGKQRRPNGDVDRCDDYRHFPDQNKEGARWENNGAILSSAGSRVLSPSQWESNANTARRHGSQQAHGFAASSRSHLEPTHEPASYSGYKRPMDESSDYEYLSQVNSHPRRFATQPPATLAKVPALTLDVRSVQTPHSIDLLNDAPIQQRSSYIRQIERQYHSASLNNRSEEYSIAGRPTSEDVQHFRSWFNRCGSDTSEQTANQRPLSSQGADTSGTSFDIQWCQNDEEQIQAARESTLQSFKPQSFSSLFRGPIMPHHDREQREPGSEELSTQGSRLQSFKPQSSGSLFRGPIMPHHDCEQREPGSEELSAQGSRSSFSSGSLFRGRHMPHHDREQREPGSEVLSTQGSRLQSFKPQSSDSLFRCPIMLHEDREQREPGSEELGTEGSRCSFSESLAATTRRLLSGRTKSPAYVYGSHCSGSPGRQPRTPGGTHHRISIGLAQPLRRHNPPPQDSGPAASSVQSVQTPANRSSQLMSSPPLDLDTHAVVDARETQTSSAAKLKRWSAQIQPTQIGSTYQGRQPEECPSAQKKRALDDRRLTYRPIPGAGGQTKLTFL